jgi:SPP1 gp7 family putative phage head morphogenesis protein
VTETTRAFASGQEEAYKAEGIEEWIWSTNKDELVCPVCGPLSNKRVKIGHPFGKDKKGKDITKPPAHPNCRCWVRPGVSKPRSEPKTAQAKFEQAVQQANSQAAEAKLKSVVYCDFSKETIKEIRKYGEEISIDWRMKLKQEERKSIREYTRNGYSMLNRSLRGNLYEDDLPAEVEKSKQLIAPIDSALEKSKLPDNIRVYRGVNDIFDNVDLESLVGTIYKDNGFVSTSFSDKTSFKSKEYQFEINIPANSKGAYLGSLSAYDDRNELEVLLPRGSRFEIDAIIGNTIKMTLIP